MIHTVAEFLQALMEREKEKLPEYKEIQHPGIFGEMYEGLTQDLLKRALFDGLDLRVVRGKVRNSKGKLSGEIDCMIVLGEGEPIPYTQKFIYQIEKVVMIVEVKKTLYGAELKDSMEHFFQFWKEVFEERPVPKNLLRDSWRSLFKTESPQEAEVEALSFADKTIYHMLLFEAMMPLRIVFGYEGYVDEHGLREGFIDYLAKTANLPVGERPFMNTNTFPNLVACRTASLVKLDGMPYSGRIDQRGAWWCFASRRSNPFHTFLELLWTRLAYTFKLSPEIFGEDLEMEVMNPLLSAKPELQGDNNVWIFENFPLTAEDLAKGNEWEAWQPPVLSKNEFLVVNVLCKEEAIDMDEPGLLKYLQQEGETLHAISTSLNQKGLTTIRNNKLVLLTDECACVIMPEIGFVAAENKTGRLLRWVMKMSEHERRRSLAKQLTPRAKNP